MAAWLRKRAGVGNLWIAERLGMGYEGSVSRAVRWTREDPEGKKMAATIEAMLDFRD